MGPDFIYIVDRTKSGIIGLTLRYVLIIYVNRSKWRGHRCAIVDVDNAGNIGAW